MEGIKEYEIKFKGLSEGLHNFLFPVYQSFFDLFDFDQDFEQPVLAAEVQLKKSSSFMDVSMELSGNIRVLCDLTSEAYFHEMKEIVKWVVKFGDSFDDSSHEVWTLPWNEYQFNIAHQIYETTLLNLPTKRYHPKVVSGEWENKVQEILNQNNEEKKSIDPRWEVLKKITKK